MNLFDIDLNAPSTDEELECHAFLNERFGSKEAQANLAELEKEGRIAYEFATATPGVYAN